MSTNPKTVEGIYRDGKVELLETPDDVDEARVIVTFLSEGAVNLTERGMDETQAASLRARLTTFVKDWERREMGAYDAPLGTLQDMIEINATLRHTLSLK